jgi:tyrosine decarboxylase/aspartate 1-decarboxylase
MIGIDRQIFSLLDEAIETLESGFKELPSSPSQIDIPGLRMTLMEVAERMKDNYPHYHPFYVGQMLKPPHPIAFLSYILSMCLNPNNHSYDGGRASSRMEKEAVADIANMFGWDEHLGHLCSGGTMANLEALWVANSLKPGQKVVASQQAHYTHKRISEVLKIPFQAVPCDPNFRMNIEALETLLKEGRIGTVVATIGTTATGSVDPLPEILELQSKYDFRIHADAAYGGYFTLINDLAPDTRSAFDCLRHVDSIVIDPHKHGLQPYGCGCVLFKDPAVGSLYKHDSPYTYFSSSELHLGEISLDCSRPGSSAVALWATQRLLPLIPNGQFASMLSKSRQAALSLSQKIQRHSHFLQILSPELDIVVWMPRADRSSRISQLSKEVFQRAAAKNLHLALTKMPVSLFRHNWPEINWDQEEVMCLRSCLIKPEHLDWIDRIWELLDDAMNEVN